MNEVFRQKFYDYLIYRKCSHKKMRLLDNCNLSVDEDYEINAGIRSYASKVSSDISDESIATVLNTFTDIQKEIFDAVLDNQNITKPRKPNYLGIMQKFEKEYERQKHREKPDSVYNFVSDVGIADKLVQKGYNTATSIANAYSEGGIEGIRELSGIGENILHKGIVPLLKQKGFDVDSLSLERRTIDINFAIKLLMQNKDNLIKEFTEDNLRKTLNSFIFEGDNDESI